METGVILRKEWTEMRRDARIRFGALAVLTLLVIAMAGSWQGYSLYDSETRIGAKQTRQNFIGQDRKHPHSAAHNGIYAWKPVAPLAILDSGVIPHVGMTIWLEPHTITPARLRPERTLSSIDRTLTLSPAEVLRYFAPLLIILAGATVFSSERETGTLRQTLSTGVSRWHLLLGKSAFTLSLPFLLLLVLTGMCSNAVIAVQPPFDRGDGVLRLLLLVAGYAIYFTGWTGITIAVSAAMSSSRASLLILIGIWVLQIWILPQAAGNLAYIRVPVMSQAAFTGVVREEKADRGPELKAILEQTTRRMLEKNDAAIPDDLPFNPDGILWQTREGFLNRIFDKHLARQNQAYDEHRRYLLLASLVTPSLALRSWSMASAGTDNAHHRHFAHAAEIYRRDFVKYSHDAMLEIPKNAPYESVFVNRDWLMATPEFVYRPMPVRQGVMPYRGMMGILLLWAAIGSGGAVFAIRRMKP